MEYGLSSETSRNSLLLSIEQLKEKQRASPRNFREFMVSNNRNIHYILLHIGGQQGRHCSYITNIQSVPKTDFWVFVSLSILHHLSARGTGTALAQREGGCSSLDE